MRKSLTDKLAVLLVTMALILGAALPSCATPAPQVADFEVLAAEIPMSDGATLAADVFLPNQDKDFPAILIMTPYNKEHYNPAIIGAMQAADPESAFFPTSDYAVVTVDWRGKYASADAQPVARRGGLGLDGHDAVEWIAQQPWCDGKVGMWGQSALGIIQYQTAATKPPHLAAIMPWVATFSNSYDKYYCGGVLRKELMDAYTRIGWGILSTLARAHPLDDAFYHAREYCAPEDIEVPALVVGGWFDIHDITKVFAALKADGNDSVKQYHRMVVGPWTHTAAGRDVPQGELEFEDTGLFMKTQQKHFFDRWLRDADSSVAEASPVAYYQMGENEWRSSDTWPPATVRETQLYLQADRGLTPAGPPAHSQPDEFRSDPDNPVPTIGGNNLNFFDLVLGPADQRGKVESHEDVLIYASDVLEEDLAITGNVKVTLYVSSDCEDTDVAIRLTDVYPDGRSILLRDGIQRLSLVESYTEESFIAPGRVCPVTIETHAIGVTFLKGHRIRLIVSSSNYPRYDLNTNTRDKDGPPKVATNSLYHDTEHPSALILPVLGR